MSIVALLPGGDYAADAAAEWGRQALRSSPASYLTGANATKDNLSSARAKTVCYFGHGREKEWIACAVQGGLLRTDRTVLHKNEAAALSGSDVLAVACLSGIELGPAAKSSGATSFVGFRRAIEWNPTVSGCVAALGRCLQELVHEFLAVQPPDRNRLDVVLDKHYKYWKELTDRGSPNARTIFSYVQTIKTSMVML
jgi:hypothetical protein